MSDYERGYKAAVIDTVKRCVVSNEAERAVIEAAVAVFDGFRAEDLTPDYWKTDTVLDYRLHDLFSKLEALKEARDE